MLILLQLVLFSCAMGSLLLCVGKKLSPSPLVLFLAGAASTPFVLACYVYLIGLVWHGAPVLAFVLPPVAASILWLLLGGVPACWRTFKNWRGKNTASGTKNKTDWLFSFFPLIAGGGVAAVIILSIVARSSSPITAHDISHYLREASFFAQSPDSLAINSGLGVQYGRIFPDEHGPLYIAYWAYTVMQCPSDVAIAYSAQTINLVGGYTFFCLLSSVCAAAFSLAKKIAYPVLTVCLVFFSPNIDYLLTSLSRDSFFLTGFCLFLVVLLSVVNRAAPEKQKPHWGDFLLLFAASLFLVQGHGLGLLLLGLTGVVFIVFCLAHRVPLLTQLLWYVGMGAGGVLGSATSIVRFIQTGSIRLSKYAHLAGTPLYGAPTSSDVAVRAAGYTDKLLSFFSGWRGALLVGGIFFACALFVIWFARHKIGSKRGIPPPATLFLGGSFLLYLLPFFGMFGKTLINWFYANFRYSFFLYLTAALVIVSGLAYFIGSFFRGVALRKSAPAIVALAGCLVFFWQKAPSVDTYYSWYSSAIPIAASSYGQAASAAEAALGPDQEILINYDQMSIYFLDAPYILGTEATGDLLRAETEEDVSAQLSALNVGAFVEYPGILSGLEETAFYAYIQTHATFMVLEEDLVVYVLD